jgi:dipeptidyl aminopeptidase/acylaminoacyl peptidase
LLRKSQILTGPVSPEGRLAFPQGDRFGPYMEIWTMDVSDGGDQRRLVSPSMLPDVFGRVPISDLFSLSWSPDGSQLLFAEASQKSGRPLPDGRTMPGGSVFCALFLVNADGSGVQMIQRPDVCPWGASWSPDGSRIVVSLQNGRALITMKRDGTDVSRLLVQGLPPIVQHVAWNPVSQEGDATVSTEGATAPA